MNEEISAKSRHKQWFNFFLFAVFFFCLIALLFTYGLRYGMTRWLESRGSDSVHIGWMHLNPFTGFITLEDVVVSRKGEVVLANYDIDINVGLKDIFQHRLTIESASLNGLRLDVERYKDGRIRLGGLILENKKNEGEKEAADTKGKPDGHVWSMVVKKIHFNNCMIRFTSPTGKITLHAHKAAARHLTSDPSYEKKAGISFNGSLNDAPVNIQIKNMRLFPEPAMQGSVDIAHLELSRFNGFMKRLQEKIAGQFSAHGNFLFDFRPESKQEGSYDGELTMCNTSLCVKNCDIDSGEITWKGNLAYNSLKQCSSLVLDGWLQSSDLNLMIVKKHFGLKQNSLELITNSTIKWTGEDLHIHGNCSSLEMDGTEVSFGKERRIKSNIRKISLKECRLNSMDDIFVSRVTSADLSVFLEDAQGSYPPDEPVLNLGEVKAQDITWKREKGLVVNEINLLDFFEHIRREKNGGFYTARILKTLTGEKSPEKKRSVKNDGGALSKQMDIRISLIKLSGKNRLLFYDNSITKPFQASMDINDGKVTGIDNTRPDKPLSFQLQGSLGKHSVLNVKGTCTPFAERLGLTVNTNISDYPVSSLSPYAVDLIGYYLSQGQVNIDSMLELNGNLLDAENHFLFKKLKIKVAREDAAKKLNSMLNNIALDKALALLRDSNDHINLDLPVRGPLDDLKVGFNDIAKKVVSKAVIHGAKTYLLTMLAPYGTLISVGMKVGEHLLKVRLPPVSFAPGEFCLKSKQKIYLKKLVKILRERPELEVTMSGIATTAERSKMINKANREDKKNLLAMQEQQEEQPLTNEEREQLLELGKKRAIAVREYMIKKYDIHQGRMFISESSLDEDEQAEPRVEMGF